MCTYVSNTGEQITLDWDNDFYNIIDSLEDYGEDWVMIKSTVYTLV